MREIAKEKGKGSFYFLLSSVTVLLGEKEQEGQLIKVKNLSLFAVTVDKNLQ